MQKLLFLTLTVAVSLCSAVTAQSVVVSPKKIEYTRTKPSADFKRTFTVTYPKVKAPSPTLARRIERTISYANVLQLDIRDELKDSQWLEEAGYTVDYNSRGVLVVTLSMYGTAAYPDGVSKTVAVDLRNGQRITPADAFVNASELVDLIRKKQRSEIDLAIAEMRKDPEMKDDDPAQLFAEKEFSAKDLAHFSINDAGITFIFDYGFPHVLEAQEPEGSFEFKWQDVAAFVKASGPFGRFLKR